MGGGDIHIDHQEEGLRRRGCGCSCSKKDFLPEESFQSFGNYLQALKETPMRFKDRLLTRSKDTTEIHEIKARSEHEMKKTLTWWDLIWFGIGAVIGAGIFVLTGLEAREHAGPAVVLSYVVSGVSAMLSVFCYTEFAVEIPVAGMYSSIYIFCAYLRLLSWSNFVDMLVSHFANYSCHINYY
jgi:APA family basic amino acid/polyamine antiporter